MSFSWPSRSGATAPLVCDHVPVQRLILVNAMIPRPGETAGDWWGNTGSTAARTEAARRSDYSETFDLDTYFLHDVPDEIAAEGAAHARDEAESIFAEPCRFSAWPQVPIHVIAGADDRFFPMEFQRRVAKERLGVGVDVLPGGHLVALSNPLGLAEQLLSHLQAESHPRR
jgi:pimeloyl-ACP methyl ester carboxylesterase